MSKVIILDSSGDTTLLYERTALERDDGQKAVAEVLRMLESGYAGVASGSAGEAETTLHKGADVPEVLRSSTEVLLFPNIVGG